MIMLLLCAFATGAYAQITMVSGTITDKTDGLMGATIAEIDGANRIIEASLADINGHFTMKIKNPKDRIKFSYVGYKAQILPINRSVYKIVLEDATALRNVTIVSKKKISTGGLEIPEREISFASQTISTKEFEGLGLNTIDEALQGRIAGLDIVTNSGNLGSGSSMRLRGASTISSVTSSEPLIVVNGNIQNVDQSNFDVSTANDEKFAQLLNINPEDIEDISVLKDAAATAPYGSQGANGVILIKTKRGHRGKARLTYSFRLTGTYQPKGYSLLNGDDYTMLLKESYFNPKQSDAASDMKELNYDPTFSEYQQYNNNTDWVKAVTQTGFRQNHYLSITGGGEKATFRISGGYDHETGSVIKQVLDRFSTRVALDYDVSDRIKISTDFSMTYTNNQKNYDGLLALAYKKMPNMGIYEENPTTGAATDKYYEMLQSASSEFNDNQKTYVNPVASANLAENKYRTYDIAPQFEIQYNILGLEDDADRWHLKYNGRVNMSISNAYTNKFYPAELTTTAWSNGVNTSTAASSKSLQFNTQQTLTLTPHFNNKDHSMLILGRFELTSGSSSGQTTDGVGLASGGLKSPDAGGQISSISSTFNQWRSMYYTFQTNYTYKGRYVAFFSIRADGTTKFGPNKRWGYFPALSFRWNIIDESWMKGTEKWLSMLALRPGWGRNGNQPSADYLYESKYSISDKYIDMSSMYPNNIRLTNLRWETHNTYNVGMDLGFFDNKITMDLNWYTQKTTDMLMSNVAIPTSTGFSSLPYSNAGSLTNTGWEFNIQGRRFVQIGKFSLDCNLTFANNSNKINSMDETVLESLNSKFTEENRDVLTRVQVNNPFGAIYGFRFKGVYQYNYDTFADMTAEEQAAFVASGKTAPVALNSTGQVIYNDKGEPVRMMYCYGNTSSSKNYKFKGGDAMYEDINHDGNINELDIVYLGSSLPKLTGGFGFRVTLNNSLSLNAQFNYRIGNKILNLARLDAEAMISNNNQSQAVNYRWRKEGDVTSIPRAMYGSTSNYNTLISDRFVEDGSFLRLNYVQLSYAFKTKMLKQFGLSQLNLYLSAQNLFILTKYTGVDPEISYSSYGAAIDSGQTPRAKSFTLGITVGF
jgi:TonB-linked SusC/RagA family outer membrane protein